ncbi:MAG: primosomal protein N' [Deltaproteobacteria bacterium]|nr:primosomal protein N' [Deltaproteobacteria bacterium]
MRKNTVPELFSCLRIAVSAPVSETFFYKVPEGLESLISIGSRVTVPFNHRHITGYVIKKIFEEPGRRLKEITDLLSPDPLFSPQMIPFFEWMADYYRHPLGMVIDASLPGEYYKSAKLTRKGQALVEGRLFDEDEIRLLRWIGENPGKKLPWPMKEVYPLQEKGWIRVENLSNPRNPKNPSLIRSVRPKSGIDFETALLKRGNASTAKNEIEFLKMVFKNRSVPLSRVKCRFKNGPYLVNKWEKKGILEHHSQSALKPPEKQVSSKRFGPHPLNSYQLTALAEIKDQLDLGTFGSFLLYGVTGSGKTEVYARAIECLIEQGRQAILMAPEILLAGYLAGVLRHRLGKRVALYHSGLSKRERLYQWSRMAAGEVDLVIGARSALFAPLPRLGLIIVDEEHDTAYVQAGNAGPPYCARDAAVVRARLEGAVVVLGSGTPSVQSFQNTQNSRYHLLQMPERVKERPMPSMEIVDMRKVKDGGGEAPMISPALKKALKENLDAGNQTILFLNRRGFHQIFLCRSCGQALRCPNCDVSLTFHLHSNRLACHYCGFKSPPNVSCKSCGGHSLKPFGFGTEKMEVELNVLFPGVRISRMDTDSTRMKGSASDILKAFAGEKTDILVGTQMITKGYDFPRVTLVGVVAADLSLGFPDFRAGERTFQLLSQVAGRAGRGDRGGRVIIQTFNPDHYVIQAAVKHDFKLFFTKEKNIRQQLRYPPFSNLACLKLQGSDAAKAGKVVRELGLHLKQMLGNWPNRGKEIQLLGPVSAPMSRLKGKFRWQLLVKCGNASLLKHFLGEAEKVFDQISGARQVRLLVDVDPYDML